MSFEETEFGRCLSDKFEEPSPTLCALSSYGQTLRWQNEARYFFALMAVNMPCRMAEGVGGHPFTTTSTGMTLEILPQVA